ncbi:MAG: DNA topoisomerase (ATP-hydrolyzing) subunit B [Candidatus Cloacimonadota bacterium]|nr:MAG: DNA topoisomerase (ATP-hydrolyzing) subunit B [Candidatus Cloacimonadota bacterium]PIE78060.1 MAG: DNA topoisomerase (ATP-hydrolyzing) subunit B [Candidatus Delongbacteria bacterium]
MEEKINTENNNYSADTITVLKGLEAVRMRPAMYIGDVGFKGLHHLVNEVVDNSIDEALAGHCSVINVEITEEGGISVEDDGRGIPIDLHSEENKPAVEVVMTILHAGGKFDKENYKVSGGLHGVGVSCVNALSTSMVTEVFKDGKHYRIGFKRGLTISPLEEIGTTDKKGTKQTFYPDPEIFETTTYDFNTVAHRLRVLSFLNKGVRITLTDSRVDQRNEDGSKPYFDFQYEGGLTEFVTYIDENKTSVCDPIYIDTEKDGYPVEIALSWNTSYRDHIESYVNNIHTIEGGTHEEGMKSGLTRAVNKYAISSGLFKNDKMKLSGSDVREGLTCVISIKVMEPQFEGQTKTKLGNNDVTGIVQSLTYDFLYSYFEENPKVAKTIIDKCTEALRAREAARKAKEMIRRKSAFEGGSMPGKLSDCSKGTDPMDCELFIVEGDSAGGSAVDGRDIKFQAILPLRGKILNVEKARLDKMLSNEEVKSLITAIGTGVGEGEDGFNYSKLRYGKIVIMTDADVDGAHISTLLLTFFFRYMPELIEKGNIYLAMPPLYKIQKGKKVDYVHSDEEKDNILNEYDSEKGIKVQRYKGLGEMNPDQLKETTLDPENRFIKKINISDAVDADRIFTMLMGVEVPMRREFIIENCKFAENIDI